MTVPTINLTIRIALCTEQPDDQRALTLSGLLVVVGPIALLYSQHGMYRAGNVSHESTSPKS